MNWERTFRHAVAASRVPTMNQSDQTMPSAVCGRAASIGMDAPCSLPSWGETGRADMRKPAVLDQICWLTAGL